MARLLREIQRLVAEAGPEAELDALRWSLAAIMSHDSAYSERAAA